MKLTRFMLVLSVVLLAYCVALLVLLLATMIPWVWLVFVGGGLVALYKKRRQWHAFGTARWAETRELWARGMIGGGTGLIVGTVEDKTSVLAATKTLFDRSVPAEQAVEQFLQNRRRPKRKLVRLNNSIHTAIFAPTGVGKGVSCVIPFLLTCPESCVVVDFKGENAILTAEARRKMGHKVVILDPFKVVTQSPDTFNALQHINGDDPLACDDSRDIGAALVVRSGGEKEPHWNDSAEAWISALVGCVVRFGEGENRSLQTVRTLLSDPAKTKKAIELMCGSDAWSGMLSRMGFALTRYVDRELGSVLTTTNRHLRFLDTVAIADSTKSSSFDPADLTSGKMTVYLVLPPEHMRTQSPLLRLWIGAMLRACVRGGLQERRKVHFVLDEAASLGHMEALDDAVDKYRGYGVRCQFYYQSWGQLLKCFPEGQEQTLLSNVTQVFFGVNDNQTAKYVSERLGKGTIVIESGGTGTSCQTSSQQGQGGGSSSYSSGRSNNDNWQQSGRELLLPSEVMNLDPRIALIFTPGVRPIWTTLIRYYEVSLSAKPRKVLAAAKAFAGAAFFLVAMGGLAALLTLGAREKWQNEGTYPVQTEQWQGDRRPPTPVWFRQSNDNPAGPGNQGEIDHFPVPPGRRQEK